MNTEFSRIITLLRKERKLSQKRVANDLGISQALLSHYEKGIRECGLDFVVKTADYYNVSCDYLLGRTTERSGATLTVEDNSAKNGLSVSYGNVLAQLNKKLIQNSTSLIFDIVENSNSNTLNTVVTDHIMTSVYKIFRLLYTTNPQNPQAMFAIPKETYSSYALAYQAIKEAEFTAIANGKGFNDAQMSQKEGTPTLSQEILTDKYPEYSSSMLNLIKIVENSIKLQYSQK